MTNEAKKQILHTFSLVEKLRKILEKAWEELLPNKVDEFSDLLEQYQGAVIQVGTSIEKCTKEEERRNVIQKMEQYCEQIYQVTDAVLDQAQYRRALIALRELHRDITSDIEKMSIKPLALFIPYKYSMWDSLESIYLAVKADEEWDALLLPIPYKECKEDGEEQWIYEGPEYYQGLDACDFREVNYAELKPDVVYIHNPYDGINNVTSVAPEYYSSSLKEHCGKIVYVPYFFTNSEFPGIHRDLPTYANFDYIVVPSEKARDQMTEYIGAGKVLALGSPKLDRMIYMQDNYELPDEWQHRIRGRKVVLYNISLNSILQNGFQTILKMNYVFEYFKTNQNVVLWWRPHPLIKSTMKTMRPELLGAYEAMEKKFVLEKIGIYDLTPDSNRAIAATDAFMGDYSSMCGLYGMLGKPIFLLDTTSMQEPSDMDRRSTNLMYPVCLEAGKVTRDGKIFCYAPGYRALCLLNPDDFSLELVHQFEDEYYKLQAFHESDAEQAVIYFFPSDRDHKTLVYKVTDGSISECETFVGIPTQRYGLILDLGEEWLLAPREETKALYINKLTGKQTETNNYNLELHQYSEMTGDPLLSGCAVKIGEKLYVLAYQTGKFLVLDLKEKTTQLMNIGDGTTRFSTAAYVKDSIWLAAWNGNKIAKYNPATGEYTEFTQFPEDYYPMASAMKNRYTPANLGMFLKGDKLVIVPFLADKMLTINTLTGEIATYLLNLPYEEGQRKASYFNDRNNYLSLVMQDQKSILLQTAYDKSLIRLNLETDEIVIGNTLIPEEMYQSNRVSTVKQAARDRYQSPYYIHEKGLYCTLNDMITFVKDMEGWDVDRQKEASCEGVINANGSCGQQIHDFVKKHI